MKFFLYAFSFLLLLASCQNNVFYEKIDTIPNETWNIDSTYSYTFEITDSLKYYNFLVNVRNTIDYPYQKFYVFMTTEFPSGMTSMDTLGCIMCDIYGNWTGKGSGKMRDNQFVFRKKVRFQQKGEYTLSVQQGMRDDDIKGIANFGISLNYYNDERK